MAWLRFVVYFRPITWGEPHSIYKYILYPLSKQTLNQSMCRAMWCLSVRDDASNFIWNICHNANAGNEGNAEMPLSPFSIKLIESFKDKNCDEWCKRTENDSVVTCITARTSTLSRYWSHTFSKNHNKCRDTYIAFIRCGFFLRFIGLLYEYRRYKVYLMHDME